MAESIFARMSRLLSATVEESVDRMGKAGGEAVMREAIREADRAVDQVEREMDIVVSRRLQAKRQRQLLAKRLDELSEKARFALDQGREDLAEAALSRQIDFEAQAESLNDVQVEASEEETRLAEGLAALKARKIQMEEALASYVSAKSEAPPRSGAAATRPERSAKKKVDAAEQAFDRAMKGVVGTGLQRTDSDAIHRVAEIDGLQKRATIAERLAALKADRAA